MNQGAAHEIPFTKALLMHSGDIQLQMLAAQSDRPDMLADDLRRAESDKEL